MRGAKQITRAHGLPEAVPGSGTKGEKAKLSRLGAMVFFTRLVSPNRNPKNAPFLGPSSTEPMITGTCRIVALMMAGR